MEEIDSEEQILADITFNSITNKIILPHTYESFIEKIGKILNLNQEQNSYLRFSYEDLDNNNITVTSDDGYDTLKDDIKYNNVEKDLIIIKLDENSNIDIDACTQSFIQFFEENNLNQKEVFNEEQIIDDEKNNINVKNNNDEIMLLKEEKNKDNININIDNNRKETNDTDRPKFYIECTECKEYPIIDVFYYCLLCGESLCQKCEDNPLINHPHALFKVQSKEQFSDLQKKEFNEFNSKQSSINKIKNNLIFSFNKIFKNCKIKLPYAKPGKNNNINNINDNS